MWIRSQNYYILANVNSLRIRKCDIDGCTYYSIHGHYDRYEQELGIYSSKEKALKVLDEIQKRIEYPGSTLVSPTALKNYYRLIPAGQFYQIPADEDVEV